MGLLPTTHVQDRNPQPWGLWTLRGTYTRETGVSSEPRTHAHCHKLQESLSCSHMCPTKTRTQQDATQITHSVRVFLVSARVCGKWAILCHPGQNLFSSPVLIDQVKHVYVLLTFLRKEVRVSYVKMLATTKQRERTMQAFLAHQCSPLVGTANAHHSATCDPGRQSGVTVKSTSNGDRKPR